MVKYHIERLNIEDLNHNDINRIQLEMIPANARVLEIGCATGYMSQYLEEEKKCQVTGIELDPAQADIARHRCSLVLEGSVNSAELQTKINTIVDSDGGFDVIFMSQVIEHIAFPETVLTKLHDWINRGGFLLISTCNVAHWRCRLSLLAGNWQYEDYGIMDRSHLRFFTFDSFKILLLECGYDVTEEAYSFEDFCPFRLLIGKRIIAPSDVLRLIPFIGRMLRKKHIHLTRRFIASQFVYKAFSTRNK